MALSKLQGPLEQWTRYINFERFRAQLVKVFDREDQPATGRRPFDTVLMLKISILQRLYHLSDEQADFRITDRLSFTRFLGLKLGSQDSRLHHRVALTGGPERGQRGEKPVRAVLTRELEEKGVIGKSGVIVDASFVDVPRQRNTREENNQIKDGTVPPAWKDDQD